MNEDHFLMNTTNVDNSNEEDFELRKGPWTIEEDNLLIQYVDACGEGRWNALAKGAGLKRTGKSCRLRWLNYLKPDTKRGNLTPQEQLLILELHSKWGNRWAKIAKSLPGRTDNEIKNYWRTRVQKQARQLKVDANSKTFLETFKCYWRLLEKVDQNNAAFSSSPSNSTISTTQHQDSTISHFSNCHENLTSVSVNSTFYPNNAHQEKSNWSYFSDNNRAEYQTLMKFPEIQETVTWENNNCMNSVLSDCNSTRNVCIFEEECLNQQAMTSSTMGFQEMCVSEYYNTQNDWLNYEEGGTLWST